MVEEYGSDVIQVAVQSEKTAPGLIGPDLDLVVVASGNEEWLCLMEVDASNRPIVLFESVNEGSHAVIP